MRVRVSDWIKDDSAEVAAILARQRNEAGKDKPFPFSIDSLYSNKKDPNEQSNTSGAVVSPPSPDTPLVPFCASAPNAQRGNSGRASPQVSRSEGGGVDPAPISPPSLLNGSVSVSPTCTPSSILNNNTLRSKNINALRDDAQYELREIVIGKNGQPRQAGASSNEGEWIKRYKERAEKSLFVFAKGILGLHFLTPHFHREICQWVQVCPPFRKLCLMPREHVKTGIISNALPTHILIQPADGNIYFPGLDGAECRILLAGETASMAQKNLRVIKSTWTDNKVFRAFWPERVWDNERQSAQWNNEGIIIPRKNEWPDPTIRAVGVGAAVTGSRPNVMIKDDLTTFAAANSETIMQEAIDWHKASRALLDKYEVESGLQSLEFIAMTRWAVYDLAQEIIDNDPSVEVNEERFHRIIFDGKILWPEKYTEKDIEQLRHEHGRNFYLLYLNSAANPELTDFDINLVRDFKLIDGVLIFEEDERDELLKKRLVKKAISGMQVAPPVKIERGMTLNSVLMKRMAEASGGYRARG